MSIDSLTSPSAPARDAAMPRRNRGARRFVIGLLILAVAVNVLLPFLLQRTDATVLSPVIGDEGDGIGSESVVLAAPLDAANTLVATLDNRVLWLENGAAAREAQFDNLVGGLAISADGQKVYVGTSGGQIFVLDAGLQTQRQLPITGRVVGLRAVPAGGFLAAYGSGAFSDRYWTSYYPPEQRPARLQHARRIHDHGDGRHERRRRRLRHGQLAREPPRRRGRRTVEKQR